ncbi:MAG TPA: bifunctional phosphoribosyl-AMP cyclohydrolase/phosphoribosyl-ATP diphosphatase HisIE [Pyrinomonadaceae bacterium]|nr:bifunctional phosphoribosyl-AMP cyclohydrolase/phosphoribosyl-ATP diphosphatase HisIE [Pyrinomonadaceae bacterium]
MLEELRYDERGLVPVVVQDARTREVLTLAYMSAESARRTLDEGETWFWSRSRAQLWHKGETSGHTQRVRAVVADCDTDALLVLVEPNGAACHTGALSCFQNEIEGAGVLAPQDATPQEAAPQDAAPEDAVLEEAAPERAREQPNALGATLAGLYDLVESRQRERPAESYTTYLFERGLDKILKKVGEESAETIIAAKNEDAPALVAEVSDLLYHLLVLLVERGVKLEEVESELSRRGMKGVAR